MALTLASNAITFTDNTSLSSGIIGTAQLSAGAVTNAQIASDAAIDGSKITPDFGSQGVRSSGTITAESNGAANIVISRASDDGFQGNLRIRKARGSQSARTVVLLGDTVGNIEFGAYDGSDYSVAARIAASVDGTPGANDMPGRLTFWTTADGASAATERMWINSFGSVSFNSTGASTNTTVGGATWTKEAYHVLYRNTASSSTGIVDYYSNWGTTKRNVFRVRADGNVLNFNNSYGSLSDASLKENITDATPKLEDINNVRVVNFNFKGDDNKQIGVIAQEIEQVWPSIVSTEEDGTKSVKYSVLVPILIKAVQELKEQLDSALQEIAELKSKS
jgi:hypothetical protein